VAVSAIDSGDRALLRRAKGYPYDIPESCYALAGGRTVPLVGVDLSCASGCQVLDDGTVHSLRAWAERQGIPGSDESTPELLLAYGSNASVDGLSRKLAECLESAVIPVARATLADFDVVYSAHISAYGSIPATLQHFPGSRTTVFVLAATSDQCGTLRATEPNYHFVELHNVDLRLDLGPTLRSVPAVISRHGALTLRGTQVGVAAVTTSDRQCPAMTQAEVLSAVRDLVAPERSVDEFILENVRQPDLARRRSAALKGMASPFAWRSWDVIDPEHPSRRWA
jgi:hypothetical protein